METIGAIVTILAFLYMLIWGEKSIAEILGERRKKRQQKQLIGEASQSSAPLNKPSTYSGLEKMQQGESAKKPDKTKVRPQTKWPKWTLIAGLPVLIIMVSLWILGPKGITTPPSTEPPSLLIPWTPTPDLVIQAVLNKIGRGTPAYHMDFADWGPYLQPDGNVKIENGRLIGDSQNLSFGGALGNIPASDRFAVAFDFRVQKSKYDSGSCTFQVVDGSFEETNIGLAFGFDLYGLTRVAVFGPSADEAWEGIASSRGDSFDVLTFNKATIIILGDQITTFINDQLMYTVVDSRVGAFYEQYRLGADSGAVCEFDNYKIWNLVNFSP